MADVRVERWQARMAPFMAALVLGLAIFFGVVTLFQFSKLEARLAPPHDNILATVRGDAAPPPSNFGERLQLMRESAAIALEQDVIARRYEEANTAVIARLWTRFMGFLTGMTLALIGAAFVLGKLNDQPAELNASHDHFGLSFRSSSPGLVLSVLGTILMTISLIVPVSTDVRDVPAYFGSDNAVPAADPLAAVATDLSMQNAPKPSSGGAQK